MWLRGGCLKGQRHAQAAVQPRRCGTREGEKPTPCPFWGLSWWGIRARWRGRGGMLGGTSGSTWSVSTACGGHLGGEAVCLPACPPPSPSSKPLSVGLSARVQLPAPTPSPPPRLARTPRCLWTQQLCISPSLPHTHIRAHTHTHTHPGSSSVVYSVAIGNLRKK